MGNGDVVGLRGKEVDVQFCRMVAANLPAVLVGAVDLWPAISRWDPRKGGLEYLKNLAGTTRIKAITSKSASVFYGHIKGHERVSLTFGSFIDLIVSESKVEQVATSPSIKMPPATADSRLPKETFGASGSEKHDSASADSFGDKRRLHDLELYLAQVPIHSTEEEGEAMLSLLMQDISTPPLLESKEVSNINLWMSMKSSRSSTHYDPYHNILCVVAGEKRVTLWPPSAAPYLYPLPIYGEASNHSGVDIVEPDFDMYPLFRKALQNAKMVTLRPGDALFIPEGWYHQVDNIGITIAVNFWWPSEISLSLGSQMDGYILRRVVSSLLDHEKKRMVTEGIDSSSGRRDALVTGSASNLSTQRINLTGSLVEQDSKVEDVQDLTAEEASHLRTLVTSVLGETTTSASADFKRLRPREDTFESHHTVEDNIQVLSTNQRPFMLEEDVIGKVFATLGALSLQRVLLVMAAQFPRSLRILVMEMLSPAAAELLTMKFEELDSSLEASLQAEFYEKFYSVFENPEAVMAILLEKKEAFAAQALRIVMLQFLGLSCTAAPA